MNTPTIALVYCPAIDSPAGAGGPELAMPPIGICSLAAHLRANGYHSTLFDLMLEFDTSVLREDLRRPLTDLFAAVRSEKAYDPDVLSDLGFYLGLNRNHLAREVLALHRDLDSLDPARVRASGNDVRRFFAARAEELAQHDIVGLSIVLEEQQIPAQILAAWIRALSRETSIVVGGPGARPDAWRKRADLVVRGDGEAALLAHVMAPNGPGRPAGPAAGSPEPSVRYQECLDDLPTPDFTSLFARHEYLAPVRIIPLAVTRGCYWSRCLFCSFGWRSDDPERCTAPYRKLSADRVAADILLQKRANATDCFFFSVDAVDPVFLEELADTFLRTSVGVFWCTGARAEKRFLEPGLLQKLYRAGCRSFSCGYESFNQRVLDSMRKGIRVEHSVRLLGGLYEAGIRPNLGYFMGWPGETPAESAETQAAVNLVCRKVPGNLAEPFVLVPDSPVVRIGHDGTWDPLRYLRDKKCWCKQGMDWEAQDRQWLIFATNFYCDSKISCLPVRGDGGYAFLYSTRYPVRALGDLFRTSDRSFGVLGRGRLLFYGFYHTRHYCSELGRPFNVPKFLQDCPSSGAGPADAQTETGKLERLDFAYGTVRAFLDAHDLTAEERDFMRQVAQFDYGLLASTLADDTVPLVQVGSAGELLPCPETGGPGWRDVDFTIDVRRVAQFAPVHSISMSARCRVRFHTNGFQLAEDGESVCPPGKQDSQEVEPIDHLDSRMEGSEV